MALATTKAVTTSLVLISYNSVAPLLLDDSPTFNGEVKRTSEVLYADLSSVTSLLQLTHLDNSLDIIS